jgi:hypothetical protein
MERHKCDPQNFTKNQNFTKIAFSPRNEFSYILITQMVISIRVARFFSSQYTKTGINIPNYHMTVKLFA